MKNKSKTEEVVSKKEDVIKYGGDSGKVDDNRGQPDFKMYESLVAVNCLKDSKEEYVVTHDPFNSTHTIRPNMCTQLLACVSHNLTPQLCMTQPVFSSP